MMSCQRYAATRRCTRSAVFVTGADPLKFGFAASFNKLGANITGIWMVLIDLAEKRLQLLHDLVPTAKSNRAPCQSHRPRSRATKCRRDLLRAALDSVATFQ